MCLSPKKLDDNLNIVTYIYIYVHLIPTFFELMKVPIRISLSLMKIPVKQCLLFLSQNCGWLQIYTNLYTSYQFFSYLPLFQSHETLRISARPSRPSQHTPLVSGLGESGPYQGGLALHIVHGGYRLSSNQIHTSGVQNCDFDEKSRG